MLDPTPPSQVGPYRIVRLVGEGGMGRVFEAEQQSPRRRVALKLVRVHSPDLMRRFALETDVLARLHHPGIAGIYECGEHDSGYGPHPYFAMEYVDGIDVRTHADRAKLDVNGEACAHGGGRRRDRTRAYQGRDPSRPEAGQRAGERETAGRRCSTSASRG